MPQDVGADAGAGEQRITRLGLVFPDDPCDAAAAEPGPVLVEEHRVIIAAGLVKSLFFHVGGQQGDSAAVQGDVAGLAALAGQRRQGRVLQADVADGQAGEFGDPGPGVVERGEQGRVAPALPGGPVGPGEQEPGLADGQVPDGGTVLLLGRDGEDGLPVALWGPSRLGGAAGVFAGYGSRPRLDGGACWAAVA